MTFKLDSLYLTSREAVLLIEAAFIKNDIHLAANDLLGDLTRSDAGQRRGHEQIKVAKWKRRRYFLRVDIEEVIRWALATRRRTKPERPKAGELFFFKVADESAFIELV
jgi:hypothetical protein